jgi:hypothetical protein
MTRRGTAAAEHHQEGGDANGRLQTASASLDDQSKKAAGRPAALASDVADELIKITQASGGEISASQLCIELYQAP